MYLKLFNGAHKEQYASSTSDGFTRVYFVRNVFLTNPFDGTVPESPRSNNRFSNVSTKKKKNCDFRNIKISIDIFAELSLR